MKYSTVMATAGLVAVAHAQELPETFQPGLEVTPTCIANPSINHCPAKLPSGNALLTSWSYVVRSDNDKQPGDTTLFRVQFVTNSDGEVIEDRTLSLFDMPPGHEDKQCRFKFIYNFGNAYPDGEYNVWALDGDGADVTVDTTWDTKPEATEKLATFITGDKSKGDLNPDEDGDFAKMDGTFVENPTFPCPGPGKFAFETRGNDPEKLNLVNNVNPLNLAGGDGLAIEILDVPSGYNNDGDNDDTEPPTTTTTQVLSIPHPTGVIPLPPSSTTTLVPIPSPGDNNDDNDNDNEGPPPFEGGASHATATAFFSGAVLMAAALPLLF